MECSHYATIYAHESDHWWHRVRRELVHDLLRRHFGDRTDLTLTDIGCGAGTLTKELERYGECVGIDPSDQAIAYSRARGVGDVRIGSAEATGLESGSRDAVICLDVLEHLPDDMLGITEIRRILKPGGIAIIFVPAFKSLWGVTDELSHHYRRYRLRALERKFTSERFSVLRRTYFNTLLFVPIMLVRIFDRLLGIRLRSETTVGGNTLNTLLYKIFGFERRLLRRMNFMFGVSGLRVVQKVG